MGTLSAVLERKPWHLLSGTGLKWIAVVTMLIDHLGATLVWSYYLLLRQQFDPAASDWYDIYMWMRRIGRIAFPLFCFVLVEGFVHTHSKPKYALRMLLFGIVAELPYDFALHGGVAGISYTDQLNIMFTLLLAFCALWLADEVGTRFKFPWWGTMLLTVGTLALAAWLAGEDLLDVSYHAYGVILIGVLYLARNHRFVQFLLGCGASALYCVEHGSWLQMFSVASLACIAAYNGKRGRGMKYFFYLFYPVHLLILGLLNMWLF